MEQKFTTMAQEAISDAVQNASAAGNAQVETLHLLDALLRQENGVIRGLIEAAGGNAQNISAAVHQAQDALPSASGSTTAQPQVSRQLSAVLAQAGKEMQQMGENTYPPNICSSPSRRQSRIRARKSWNNTA